MATVIEQIDGQRRYNRMSIEELCNRAGMAKRTYHRRLHEDPDSLTVGEIQSLKKAMRLKDAITI